MVTVQLVDSPVALAVATVVLLAGRGPLTAALVLVLPPVVRGWTLEIWRALHELRLVLGPAPCRQEAVDPVTRISEDVLDTPLLQALQDVVGYLHRHSDLLFAGAAAPLGRLAATGQVKPSAWCELCLPPVHGEDVAHRFTRTGQV